MKALLCLLALLTMQAVARATVIEPKDLVGTWQAQRQLTFLELHSNFTYDRYFADVFDQGRWTLRNHSVLELFVCSAADKKVVTERNVIKDFGGNVMRLRDPDGRSDVWKKVNYSRHMPRLSH